jgi:hypothetical protein
MSGTLSVGTIAERCTGDGLLIVASALPPMLSLFPATSDDKPICSGTRMAIGAADESRPMAGSGMRWKSAPLGAMSACAMLGASGT